ncbi:[LysW]-lysine hydrolase [bacterium]|nr:[LysW]-lysine hydrolase [bacterium]
MRRTEQESIAFLESLVRCFSPSTKEEEVSHLAVQEMKDIGFAEAWRDEVGNAIGIWGERGQPTYFLVGHIDTVPGEIPVRREELSGEEVLFGRGSVDAKGSFATFVQAVGRLPKDLPVCFIVVGAVEEEVASSKGARHLLTQFAEPEGVIIGEPSGGDGITLGYKGRLLHELSAKRAMTHSASPFATIGDLLSLWGARVHTLARESASPKAGFRSLDATIQQLQVTNDGFTEEGKIQFGFRIPPSLTPDEVERHLREEFPRWRAQFPADETQELEIHFFQREVAAEYSKKSSLAGAFRKAIRSQGLTPRHVVKTGTSDMNVLAAGWNCPMVAYGPGDSDLDHTPNEHLSLQDYCTAIRVLEQVLLNLSP